MFYYTSLNWKENWARQYMNTDNEATLWQHRLEESAVQFVNYGLGKSAFVQSANGEKRYQQGNLCFTLCGAL